MCIHYSVKFTLTHIHHLSCSRPFNGTMHSLTDGRKEWYTKLSSAGLVYLHFGERVIAQLLSLPQEDKAVQVIYDKVCCGTAMLMSACNLKVYCTVVYTEAV